MTPVGANVTSPYPANKTLVPAGCLVLQYEDFLPWDDPRNVISVQVENLVRRLKDAVILPILFLIGGPSNVINMAVFQKAEFEGKNQRVPLCLGSVQFSLPPSNVLAQLFGSFAMFIVNHNLTGFNGFHWVSQVLCAIIASERCFCILYPLRSQTLLSTSTITAIIVVISTVIVGLYFFVVSRYRVMCVNDPVSQLSTRDAMAGEFYLLHQKLIDYLDAFVYGAGLPGVMMVVVMITTILTMKLRVVVAWRAGTSSSGGVSPKEIALTRMLVANSVFFIVCIFPNVLFRFVWLLLPDMKLGASQHNLFLLGLWLLDIVSWVNSSFNIVIYYTMGSRYRHTLWMLVGSRGRSAMQKESVTGRV